jgi:hypothetical protein
VSVAMDEFYWEDPDAIAAFGLPRGEWARAPFVLLVELTARPRRPLAKGSSGPLWRIVTSLSVAGACGVISSLTLS